MFEGAFSFRGRVGRVRYLVGQLVLMPIVGVISIAFFAMAHRSMSSLVFFVLLGLMIAIGIFWYSLSLQVRRIRDIGWSPAIVLGGCFFLCFADSIVARQYPALSIGHVNTMFGVLLNLGLMAVLYLWPGHSGMDQDAIASIAARFDTPAREAVPLPAGVSAAAMPQRIPTAPRKTFGKRGLG